jgi:hypothetical protein
MSDAFIVSKAVHVPGYRGLMQTALFPLAGAHTNPQQQGKMLPQISPARRQPATGLHFVFFAAAGRGEASTAMASITNTAKFLKRLNTDISCLLSWFGLLN